MKKLFTTRELVVAPSVTVSFEKLITVPDWWDYLVYNFLVTLHGDMTVTKPAEPPPKPPPEMPDSLDVPSNEGSQEQSVEESEERMRYMMPNNDGILDEEWEQLQDYSRKARQASPPQAAGGESESSENQNTEPNFVIPTHHLTVAIFHIFLRNYFVPWALLSCAGSCLSPRELVVRTTSHPTDSRQKGQLLRQWRIHPILQHVLCSVLLRIRRTVK